MENMIKRKVLLVDDDLDLLEQNKILLETRGYTVCAADNPDEAWELFLSEMPDAAILDLIMNEHDAGFLLSYKIKKHEHGKKIPVFILTSATYDTGFKFGAATSEEREWIKCDGILNKPANIDEIVQKVEGFYANK